MAYEMKDGQFSLFKNTRKETEKHPDFTGSIMVDGKEHDACLGGDACERWAR